MSWFRSFWSGAQTTPSKRKAPEAPPSPFKHDSPLRQLSAAEQNDLTAEYARDPLFKAPPPPAAAPPELNFESLLPSSAPPPAEPRDRSRRGAKSSFPDNIVKVVSANTLEDSTILEELRALFAQDSIGYKKKETKTERVAFKVNGADMTFKQFRTYQCKACKYRPSCSFCARV